MKVLLGLSTAFALLALSATTAATAARPAVRLLDRDPLVVRLLNFKPGETVSVRVAVRGGPRVAKSGVAGARGAFTVRFASVKLGDCSTFTVSATGSRGSRAAYTMHPPPCGPGP